MEIKSVEDLLPTEKKVSIMYDETLQQQVADAEEVWLEKARQVAFAILDKIEQKLADKNDKSSIRDLVQALNILVDKIHDVEKRLEKKNKKVDDASLDELRLFEERLKELRLEDGLDN